MKTLSAVAACHADLPFCTCLPARCCSLPPPCRLLAHTPVSWPEKDAGSAYAAAAAPPPPSPASFISTSAPPAVVGGQAGSLFGGLVVARKGGALPARCSSTAPVARSRPFSGVPSLAHPRRALPLQAPQARPRRRCRQRRRRPPASASWPGPLCGPPVPWLHRGEAFGSNTNCFEGRGSTRC